MRVVIKPSVAVIIPTIGSDKFLQAWESVRNQTVDYVDTIRVVDGPLTTEDTFDTLSDKNLYTIQLPFNTGAGGFYGHRIYSAIPHLLNHDFIFFLDEDNWYEPDHVETMIESFMRDPSAKFSHSLRNIRDIDGTFICQDNCESLGKYPVYWNGNEHLIDTSAFAFRREFIHSHCHLWHSGWGGDRKFFNAVRQNPYTSSGKYTLNYRLDGNSNSVKKEFFLEGNKFMQLKYAGEFPWTY